MVFYLVCQALYSIFLGSHNFLLLCLKLPDCAWFKLYLANMTWILFEWENCWSLHMWCFGKRWPDLSVFNFLIHSLLFPRYLSSVSQPLCPVWREHQALVCSESHHHRRRQNVAPAALPDEVRCLPGPRVQWRLAVSPEAESLTRRRCSRFCNL